MPIAKPEILVLSRYDHAEGLIRRLTNLLGPLPCFYCMHHPLADPPEKIRQDLDAFMRQRDTSRPLVIFVDLEGTTLCNTARDYICQDEIALIAGYNLPMLIKVAGLETAMPLTELIHLLVDYGRNHIHVFNEAKSPCPT